MALSVVTLALAAGLGYVLRSQGLSNTANWTQLVLFVVAILQLGPSLRRTSAVMTDSAEQLERARQKLAALVLAQWRDEIVVRQLDNPEPLTVRWRLTQLEVMDYAEQVFSGGKGTARRSNRAAKLQVSTDRIDELAREFRGLRRRRLVILGEPGMGKTTLAVLMLRYLLEHPEPGETVPVLIPVSSWNPESENLRGWLTRWLGEEYPALRAPAFGTDGPAALVTGHQILPMLDGLDELPGPRRSEVIAALNAGMTESDPLVLTSRTAEYEQAVTAPGGEVLRGAAVVEAQPLETADIATYLGHVLGPQARGTWPDVLAEIRAGRGRGVPLVDALASPLVLWLLRKVYIDTHQDPAVLNDRRRFATPKAIVDHLLDYLVPAAMAADIPQGDPGQAQTGQAWKPEDARRWLSYLAHHLNVMHSRDIAWWEIHKGLAPRPINLASGLALGLVAGLANGVIAGLAIAIAWHPKKGWSDLSLAFGIGLTAALVTGLSFAVSTALFTTPDTQPAYADLRLRGRLSPLARQIRLGLMIGGSGGIVIALVLTPLLGAGTGLLIGLTVGISTGTAGSLADWAKVPLSDDRPQSPGDTLHRDAQLTYVRVVVGMLTLAPAAGLAGGLALRGTGTVTDLVDVVIVGLVLGPVIGIGGRLKFANKGVLPPGAVRAPSALGNRVGLTPGRVEASVIYAISVLVLSLRGRRQPRRLMRFLEYTHRLGLLRQVGNIYQFRHADLQDRLAETYQSDRERGRTPLP